VVLRDRRPPALREYPDSRVDDGRVPPFHIVLAAWAVDAAADLHRQFGNDVDLHVGFLDCPSGALRGPAITDVRPRLLPETIEVSIEEDIEVRSGHDAKVEMRLTNKGPDQIVVHSVTGQIIDPATGRVVGLFAGMQAAMRVNYPVEPGETKFVAILLGTASVDPQIGHAIPPGRWAMQLTFFISDQERYRTPPIPISITPFRFGDRQSSSSQ
jgi:hypothetical protein